MLSIFPLAQAAGVIDDAPGLSDVLLKVFIFVLSIVGVLGIVGLMVAGIMYFFSGGDRRKIDTAKRMTVYTIIGILIALSAWVLVKQISGFFHVS